MRLLHTLLLWLVVEATALAAYVLIQAFLAAWEALAERVGVPPDGTLWLGSFQEQFFFKSVTLQ